MNRNRHRQIIIGAALVVASVVIYLLVKRTPHDTVLLQLPENIVDSSGADYKAPQRASATLPSDTCRDFYASACGRREITVDPTGHVQPDLKGEVEALRLYEKIIHDNPDLTSDEVDEVLVQQIYTEKRRERLLTTFTWVATAMKQFIDRQPTSVFSRAMKKKLKARIDDTRLELPPPASVYANEPDLFTKNEIYYETFSDGRRVIRVGGAYLLTAKSWFNRVFTFAHELAHSIDPCELESAGIEVAAYGRLARCFQRAGFVKGPASCAQRNQYNEAFADWLATDIVATALESYGPKFKSPQERLASAINAVRDLCHQEAWEELETELYPEPQTRIGLIYAGHPRITTFLECIPKKYYCSLEDK